VFKSKELVGSFEVEGSNDDLEELVSAIMAEARELVGTP